MINDNYPLLMCEEFWMNSQFSVARFYGRMSFGGREYIIVDKQGRDLWECSADAKKCGREKAIPAGEPADMIVKTLWRAYRKLGRDRIIDLIKQGKTEKEINQIAKGGKR